MCIRDSFCAIPALYSIESSATKVNSGLRRISTRWPISRRMYPAALRRPSTAFFAPSIPSSELTYTLQWDRSLVKSTLTMVISPPMRGSLRAVSYTHLQKEVAHRRLQLPVEEGHMQRNGKEQQQEKQGKD